jgi:VanZ family protein
MWHWLLVVLYAGLIWTVSAIPGSTLPDVAVSDKIIHVVEFGVLAFLLCRALWAWTSVRSRYCIMLFSVLATTAWGVLDEFHQLSVPYRTAAVGDVVADSLGSLLAVWCWWWAGRRWPWLR